MIKSSKETEEKNRAKNSKVVVNDDGEDKESEQKIRPSRLGDIVGRTNEKKALHMMINSAQKREEVVDHILFYGPPGLMR
jgi:Holliday junction DNA helicase RuvB